MVSASASGVPASIGRPSRGLQAVGVDVLRGRSKLDLGVGEYLRDDSGAELRGGGTGDLGEQGAVAEEVQQEVADRGPVIAVSGLYLTHGCGAGDDLRQDGAEGRMAFEAAYVGAGVLAEQAWQLGEHAPRLGADPALENIDGDEPDVEVGEHTRGQALQARGRYEHERMKRPARGRGCACEEGEAVQRDGGLAEAGLAEHEQ